MKLIRFLDEQGDIRTGYGYDKDVAILLPDDFFDFNRGFQDVNIHQFNEKVAVKKLLAPVKPAAILCIGLNYKMHAEETGLPLPEHPVLFMKNPGAVTGPFDVIEIPQSCLEPPQVDYEVELGVVMGKDARNVPEEKALEYVFGYTCTNDISARRWQKHAGGGQWVKSKSFDTFCPMGPELVTADEVGDPQNLTLICRLNGEVMQQGSTSDMIFSVAKLISRLSQSTTLLAGTLILTGTPSGVGFTRNPPVYLKPGDLLESEIQGIGRMENQVVVEGGVG